MDRQKHNNNLSTTPSITLKEEDLSKWTIEHIQINVQQGDSSLILIKNDADIVKSILIDSGENNGEMDIEGQILNTLREKINDKKLNAIIITHWDEDHYGGRNCKILEKVLDKFYDKENTHFFAPKENSKFNDLFVVEKEIKGVDEVNANKKIIYGDHKHIGVDEILKRDEKSNKFVSTSLIDLIDRYSERGSIPKNIDIEFLCADNNCVKSTKKKLKRKYLEMEKADVTKKDEKKTNVSSIGILVKYFDKTLLTCGDLGTLGSYYINQYLNNEKIDIVKINHHGASGNNVINDTFCFPNFDVALISHGENNQHDHPNIETIDALIKSIKESVNNQNKRIICTNWPHRMLLSEDKEVNQKQLQKFKYLECANINSNIETTFYYNNVFGSYDINYGDRVLDVEYDDKDRRLTEVISSEYKTDTKITRTFIKKTSTNKEIWKFITTIDVIQSNEEVNKFNDTIERYGNVVIDCFINGKFKKSLSLNDNQNVFEDIYYNKEKRQIEVIYSYSNKKQIIFEKKMFNNKEWVELDQVCCEIKENIIIKLNEKDPHEFLTHENKQCIKFEDIYYNKNNHQIEVIIDCSDDNEKIFKRHYFNEDLKFIDQLNIINNQLCYSNVNQKRKLIALINQVTFNNIKFDRNTYQFEVDCYFNHGKITVKINQLQEMIEKFIPKDIEQFKVVNYGKRGHEIKEFTTSNEYRFEQIVYNKNKERFDIISRVNEIGDQKTIQTIFINEKGCDTETIHFNRNEVYIKPSSFNDQITKYIKLDRQNELFEDIYYNTNKHRFEIISYQSKDNSKSLNKIYFNGDNWEMFETVTFTNKKEIEIYINEKQLQLQTTVPVIPNCNEITYEGIYFNKQNCQFESIYYINNQPNKIFKSIIYSCTTKPLPTQSSSNKPFIKMQFFENQQCILDNTSKDDNSTFEYIYYNLDYERIEVVKKCVKEGRVLYRKCFIKSVSFDSELKIYYPRENCLRVFLYSGINHYPYPDSFGSSTISYSNLRHNVEKQRIELDFCCKNDNNTDNGVCYCENENSTDSNLCFIIFHYDYKELSSFEKLTKIVYLVRNTTEYECDCIKSYKQSYQNENICVIEKFYFNNENCKTEGFIHESFTYNEKKKILTCFKKEPNPEKIRIDSTFTESSKTKIPDEIVKEFECLDYDQTKNEIFAKFKNGTLSFEMETGYLKKVYKNRNGVATTKTWRTAKKKTDSTEYKWF
ncbi:hypothetical protein QTN25_005710 [Entamoeba marina]